jgi:diguanylate cyclase (GGDEF)-like protein
MSDRLVTAALVSVFGVLICLILAVGQLGRDAMYRLHADARNIAEQQWVDVQLASEALDYSNQNNQLNMQIVLSDDRSEVESLVFRRTNNSARISALLAHLRTRVGSELENDRFNAVVEARNAYIESYHRVSDLVLSGDQAGARIFLTQDTFPKLLKYHSGFKDFADFQTEEMNQELVKSTARYAAARRRSGLLIVLSVLLAVGLAACVACRISSEMRSRTHAERVLNKLNEELEERVQARTSELQVTVQQLHGEIRERQKAEEQIEFLAYYDGLTGLPNRSLLRDRLTVAIANAKRRGDKVAALFLDLDNFKNVNDSLGHSAGDLLLKDVAIRLKAIIREQDTIARLGGDEFVISLTSIRSEADAAVIAARVVSRVDGRYSLQGCDLSVTCSLGISIFPDHADDVDALLKNADAAMYSAKRHGRGAEKSLSRKRSFKNSVAPTQKSEPICSACGDFPAQWCRR